MATVTRVSELALAGCFEIRPPIFSDSRGVFSKPFTFEVFREYGLETHFTEFFYSVSNSNVLRGMHFQAPPASHAKLVYCVSGKILDVALDLRKHEVTFGQHTVLTLDAMTRNALYVPSGIAHGFYVLDGPAIVIYHVTSSHAPALDTGIHWDSFDMKWPTSEPLLSYRDSTLPRFADFESPFTGN